MREYEPNTTKVTVTVPCPICDTAIRLQYTVTAWRENTAQLDDWVDGCQCDLTRDELITLDNFGSDAALTEVYS